MPTDLVLTHANLIDGTGSAPQKARRIRIRDGRIAAIEADKGPAPAGARTIDLGGAYVLPGLIDCHVHLGMDGLAGHEAQMRHSTPALLTLISVRLARQDLLAGFTTVRDAGNEFSVSIDLGKAVDEGMLVGPSIFAAGHFLSITGGHGDEQSRFPQELVAVETPGVVDSPDAMRRQVRWELRRGAKAIKLMATGGVLSFGDSLKARGFTEEEMRVAVEEAHNVDVSVLAHALSPVGIKNAVRAGVDSIDHGIFLDEEAIDLMLQHGTRLVPTMVAPRGIVDNAGHPSIAPWALEKARPAAAAHKASIHRAIERGVPIAFGTDAGTPFNLHGRNARELANLVEAGLTPMQAIEAATRTAAELIGSPAGVLAEGRPADLIVIDENPLDDIARLATPGKVRIVVKAGKVVKNGARTHLGD